MSVHKDPRGNRWIVRWRENGKQKSRSFRTKPEATAFDKQVDLLRRQGELAHELQRRRTTVEQAADRWLEVRGAALATRTLAAYVRELDNRIVPALGTRRVTALTPGDVEAFIADLRRAGTGDPTILKVVAVLQAVLSQAVADGVIPVNPVAAARKPRQARTRVPYLVKPLHTERVRLLLSEQGCERDVVLLDLLAYGGLRPELEATKLPWRNVRDRSLVVVGKRNRERTFPMVDQLRESLAAWRLRTGRPDGDSLVVPTVEGPWTDSDWRNWRRRVFRPAAIAAGLPGDVRPRDLRGSFVSLLVQDGRNIVEVSRWLGHSAETCLSTYAQVFDDDDPAARKPASVVIDEARAAALEWRAGQLNDSGDEAAS